MAQFLDAVESQIVAILESARGSVVVGSFVPTADTIARYFQSGRWRRSAYAAPLDDTSYPPSLFDRSYEIAWQDLGEDPDPQNPLDSTELVSVLCNLNVGFSYGKEIPQFISLFGSEVAATASTFVRKRALVETHSALKALTFPGIFAGDLGSSISWVECVREGKVTLDDNGQGRMVATAPLRILIEIPTGTRYDP